MNMIANDNRLVAPGKLCRVYVRLRDLGYQKLLINILSQVQQLFVQLTSNSIKHLFQKDGVLVLIIQGLLVVQQIQAQQIFEAAHISQDQPLFIQMALTALYIIAICLLQEAAIHCSSPFRAIWLKLARAFVSNVGLRQPSLQTFGHQLLEPTLGYPRLGWITPRGSLHLAFSAEELVTQ